jgi:hypothetical protein
MATAAPAKTPVHLWIVGVVSFLWNTYGVYDYVMKQTRNADYLAQMTEAERAFVANFPVWMDAAWAFGVWGALLGSLLLLIRSRFALWAFAVSLAGLLVSTLYHYGLSNAPAALYTGAMLGLNFAIWAVAITLLVYAWRMQAKGVLR